MVFGSHITTFSSHVSSQFALHPHPLPRLAAMRCVVSVVSGASRSSQKDRGDIRSDWANGGVRLWRIDLNGAAQVLGTLKRVLIHFSWFVQWSLLMVCLFTVVLSMVCFINPRTVQFHFSFFFWFFSHLYQICQLHCQQTYSKCSGRFNKPETREERQEKTFKLLQEDVNYKKKYLKMIQSSGFSQWLISEPFATLVLVLVMLYPSHSTHAIELDNCLQ